MNLFDFNKNDDLDAFERAARFRALIRAEKEEKREQLLAAGLDIEELGQMNCFARREALEQAGFDPDEYDF